MIVLQCWKCGECSYLKLGEQKVTKRQIICKVCEKPEIKVKTFEMPEPRMGWKHQ